jgi:hypothetical protein
VTINDLSYLKGWKIRVMNKLENTRGENSQRGAKEHLDISTFDLRPI